MKITYKLSLFIIFSLLCFLTIILISVLKTNNYKKKDKYNNIERYLSKANNDYSLFVKQKSISLIESYNNNLDRSKDILLTLGESQEIISIENKIDSLKNYTNETFAFWVERGLNENSGYEGEFRKNVHQLEELLNSEKLSQFTIDMLQIRRSEKDFIVRRNEKYVNNVINLVDKLINNAKQQDINNVTKESIIDLSKEYKLKFMKLVHILKNIEQRNNKMKLYRTQLNQIITRKIDYIDEEIFEFSKIEFVSYSLLFCSFLITSFMMYRRVLNPISELKDKTKSISNGNFKDTVIYDKNDEIGDFAKSFNIMLDKFLISRNELEELNYQLESKVKERTKSLQNEVEMRKLSEKKLEKYNSEIKSLLEKEKELNKLKTQFVSTVSHEYRTPLTVILNSSYLINKFALKNDYTSVKEYIEKIQFSVIQMKDLLEDTLNYGEIESSKYYVHLEDFDLNNLIKNIIQDFNTINRNRAIIFNNNIINNCVYSDKKAIHHCINNLMSNAIKFSKDEIEIELSEDNENYYITVLDQGIGIPEEDQKNIFSAFYRTSLTKNLPGTGLGLSIANKYIQALNGKLSLESKINVGTKFEIKIPKLNENKIMQTEIAYNI